MPDLIPVSYWHCKEFEEFEVNVPSSKTGVYIVSFGPVPFGPVQRDWQCECKDRELRPGAFRASPEGLAVRMQGLPVSEDLQAYPDRQANALRLVPIRGRRRR